MMTSHRPVEAHTALGVLVVLLAVLGPERPAWARTDPIVVIAPTQGAVLGVASPISVTWTGGSSTPITVGLYKMGSGGAGIGYSLPNSGQYTFTWPDWIGCDPQASYRVGVYQNASPSEVHSGIFKVTCPLTITKQVVNTTGRPASGTFRMRVQCEPGSQTFADIAGSGQGAFTRKVNVPAGSTVCTVQETGMPLPPRGCGWLTTYPGGQQRAPGGPAVVVVNTLQCGPVSPPGPR
jgi:hypothetical protein